MLPTNEQSSSGLKSDIKISFTAEGQPVEINLRDIEKVCVDLKRYNDRFSLGGTMAQMLIGHFEEKTENEPNNDVLETEKDSQQINSFFLIAARKDILEKIGLKLEPIAGVDAIITQENQANSSEMAIKVENYDRFLPFLTVLTEENIIETNLKNSLEKIPTVMTEQMVSDFNNQLNNRGVPDENLEKIIEQYKRLGMSQSVEKIEKYLEHWKKEDLPEYLMIEKNNLLAVPGSSFGPAEWQMDSTPEMLNKRWDNALDILYWTKQNQKADNLSKKLHQHLNMCVESALEDLRSNGKNGANKDKLELILEVAQQKLEMML